VQVGGVAIEGEVVVDSEAGLATVASGEIQVSVSGVQSQASTGPEVADSLVFDAGELITVSASGFLPESEAEAVIYSEPRQLGMLRVGTDGSVTAEVVLPKDLESGNHTLVISGADPNGEPVSVKFGLIVFGDETGTPIWIWALLLLLGAALVPSVAMNIRQRKAARA